MSSLLQRDDDHSPSATTLWDACLQAAAPNQKGQIMSMVHACLAACTETPKGATLALDLVDAVESHDKLVKPDAMTFALAYSAVERHEENLDEATRLLEKAARHSKKLAGSCRRKALAAARRKPVRRASDCLGDVAELLGPDFAVLAETDDFVVVHKPAGTVCHHAHKTTAGKIGRRSDVSLVDALLHVNVPLSTLNPEALGLVHRLDRGTSGCMVLTKTDRMHALLVTEFFLRNVHKTYRTVVSPVPAAHHGTLDLPVDGRPARSEFKVIKLGKEQDIAMLEMKTFTGRKHQGK